MNAGEDIGLGKGWCSCLTVAPKSGLFHSSIYHPGAGLINRAFIDGDVNNPMCHLRSYDCPGEPPVSFDLIKI